MFKYPRKFKRKVPLTVCIAAICEGGIVLGACDKMMTAGDVEFEPQAPTGRSMKVFPITNSIAVMTAGDSGLQSEIVQGL
jgi:hypothetical protein